MSTTLGYRMRIMAARNPGYEPPIATAGQRGSPLRPEHLSCCLRLVKRAAASASACADVRSCSDWVAYVIYVRQPLNHFRSLSSRVCRHERRRQRWLCVQEHHVINVINVALWLRANVDILVVVRGSRWKAAGKAAASYQVYECVQRRPCV